jgi:hypothetical protein
MANGYGTWKVGDLGRFDVEDPKRPRFEVLGSKPGRGVAVWYGGSKRPVFVPIDTFKAKCVKHWTVEVTPPLLPWIAKGACFRIDNARAARVTQAEVVYGYSRQIQQVDVKGHDLRIRHIQYDYAACDDEEEKALVMVPLKIITGFGSQVITSYERLTGPDIFGEDGDEIDQLLATLG